MSDTDPNDVVQVASGPLVQIELYQAGLKEDGIESKVVGLDLTAGLGSTLPLSVELWVHRGDAEVAEAIIAEMEAEKGRTEIPEETGTPEE
jgi:hypothetical protein